ncbi:hypothetical protein [Clostridium sp. JN-1]|mgnify:CR=1 FL=1|jgi:hypothetical protein|uniref:hypothetical protein n=1 Tax=Clostridium sp. JN-1 TaxID=2483110 RepID=UPI000F0B9A68|nr:hypothetical protein [Clostridium sp. JN-1]
MLKIEDKALNYAKQNKKDFIVKTVSASGGCCDMPVSSIVIELVDNLKNTCNYKIYEYNGVKVFIDKYLKTEENILIYQKAKLPLIGILFGSKGIYVKYI